MPLTGAYAAFSAPQAGMTGAHAVLGPLPASDDVARRLAQSLVPPAGTRSAADRAQAVRRRGRDAPSPPLALPTQRLAVRVRLPRLEIGVRVIRWVAQEVLGKRQPGAQTFG